MKKSLLLIAALVLGMAGCATNMSTQTPAQVADQVCPVVKSTMVSLSALSLGLSATSDLGRATLVVGAVCDVGKAVTTGNLQAMAGQVFPALVSVVKSTGMSVDQQNQVILDLSAAQIILTGALALNPPLTSIGTGIAVPATPAAK